MSGQILKWEALSRKTGDWGSKSSVSEDFGRSCISTFGCLLVDPCVFRFIVTRRFGQTGFSLHKVILNAIFLFFGVAGILPNNYWSWILKKILQNTLKSCTLVCSMTSWNQTHTDFLSACVWELCRGRCTTFSLQLAMERNASFGLSLRSLINCVAAVYL